MKTWKVYGLTDPRTDAIKYVGCTSMNWVSSRLSAHVSHAKMAKVDGRVRNDRKTLWIRELLTLGLRPETIVLQTAFDADEAAQVETAWIRRLPDLLNECDGGPGVPNPSPRVRARRSEINIEAWSVMSDDEKRAHAKRLEVSSHTAAANAKRVTSRRANGSYTFSAEQLAKMSAAKVGKKLSPERRAAMSAAQSARRLREREARSP